MTVTAVALRPTHLLTVEEYAALSEEEYGRTELQEGSLVMSPSPTPRHNRAAYRIAAQIESRLPTHLTVVPDVDVDLELAPVDHPGFSRRPDLAVARRTAVDRVDAEGGILRASDVCLIVEVLSPGSRRTDTIVKRAEYADAGIPHYWVVDIEPPVSLVACQLTEGSGPYRDHGLVERSFTTEQPFPVTIDLEQLR